MTTIHALIQDLAKLENIPFKIDCKPTDTYLASPLKKWVERAESIPFDPKLTKESQELAAQAIALRYRSGQAPKVSPERVEELFSRFKEIMTFYKRNREIFKENAPELSPEELSQLRLACERYPLFVEKILDQANNRHENLVKKKFDPWTEEFVKWCLRSGCSIEVFVELPHERRLLSKSHLDKRAGEVDKKEGICFQEFTDIEGKRIRALALKIDGRYVNVQGQNKEKTVELSNLVNKNAPPYVVKVSEIYKQFKEKTHFYGHIDYLQGRGISNWASLNWGSFNPAHNGDDLISLTRPDGSLDPDFHTRLPPVKTVSREELEQIHPGQAVCQPGQYGLIINASRIKTNLNIGETHGYMTFVVPTADGKFNLYPICIQATKIPQTFLQKLCILADTIKAGSVYPDESFFLSNRQRFGKFFPFENKSDFDLAALEVASLANAARKGNIIFQPQGINCAHYVQKVYWNSIGKPFYSLLEEFSKTHCSAKRQKLLEKAVLYFDDGALDKIINEMIDKIVTKENLGEIKRLLKTTLKLLSASLMKDDPALKASLAEKIAAFEKISAGTALSKQEKVKLKKELKELLTLTIRSQQHYRTYLFNANFDSGLEYIIPLIKWIPWKALRDFITSVILFITLGAWRSYTLIKPDKKGKMHRVKEAFFKSPYFKHHTFNLPASLWANTAKEPALRGRIQEKIHNTERLLLSQKKVIMP
jgi:hypothetical protein